MAPHVQARRLLNAAGPRARRAPGARGSARTIPDRTARGRASIVVGLAVGLACACDVADPGPLSDMGSADAREAVDSSAATTPSETIEDAAGDAGSDAASDAGPEVVIEREVCGPCDAARTRTCVGVDCEDWSDCVVGTCKPAGLLCGLRVDDEVAACGDHDPAASCPAGYSAVEVAALGDILTTCRLEVGNCEGAECDPARLPASGVCGIYHNGTQMGGDCAGVMPADGACPLGMSWSGRTDFGSRAGFGVQVCVAVQGARPFEGLCGWAHTRSSISGDGRFWCSAAAYQACPEGCTRLGPTDTGSGVGHGWMTCACPPRGPLGL